MLYGSLSQKKKALWFLPQLLRTHHIVKQIVKWKVAYILQITLFKFA